MKDLNKLSFTKFLSSVTILALLMVMVAPQLANALAITASKDTATRLQISELANHTVVFTLPATIDFDRTTQTDGLRVDFPATFATAGTWLAAEFTLTDSVGARTSVTPSQGAGIVDCTVAAGANNFCVAIDTTNMIFTIKPSADFTPSAAASTVTFTIAGSTGNGTFTNPAAVAATNIDIQMCDEVAACFTAWTTSHSSQIAYGIIDDDTVAVTATVNASLTFDLDTTAADTCGVTETAAPYTVALGTITNSDPRVSGVTDTVNNICVDLDTNAAGGAIVTVNNANGASGLVSTSVPADDIDSTDGSIAVNAENYGLCIVTSSAGTGTLDDSELGGYDADTCAANSHTNNVQALSTTPEVMFDTDGAPIATGRGQIAVNASITIAQPAHADYTDALTFIATGTF